VRGDAGMTPGGSPRRIVPAATLSRSVPPPISAERVADLNRTHSMAAMRSRGGVLVRAIEERRRRLVAQRVLRRRPGTVVDVGCEDGWIAASFASGASETVLVDVDPAVLERAVARGLPRARTVRADATTPGAVPAASADVVVLSAILEHLPDPGAALRAWRPALVPGGRFVVYVPADGPILLAKRLLRVTGLHVLASGVSLEPAPGHVVTFTRASLAALLAPHGAVEEIAFDPLCLGYAAVVRVP
jgi:SAM-dependent methyltransferase